MVGNLTLVVDSFCELAPNLKPITDFTFYDFAEHDLIPDAVYVFSRQQFKQNLSTIKQLAQQQAIKTILANPAEGADTMYWQCVGFDIIELIQQKKILLISGGHLPAKIPYLFHEHLLIQVHNYDTNIEAIKQYTSAALGKRPYKFLFLNGRLRTHRKYLLERFRSNGLLDQSLWTNLDPRTCLNFRYLDWYKHEDISKTQYLPEEEFLKNPFPVQSLPAQYEPNRYQSRSGILPVPSNDDLYVKKHLFSNEWGEIYLEALPYIDTYFSLVTETTFDYMHSFRTEKIAKPLAIGHPWIAAANAGFYRDLRNAGFKTFDGLIDESFDLIDNPSDRITRIAQVVEDLCKQDLISFLMASRDTCLYNQKHLEELHLDLQRQFLPKFQNYVKEYFVL